LDSFSQFLISHGPQHQADISPATVDGLAGRQKISFAAIRCQVIIVPQIVEPC